MPQKISGKLSWDLLRHVPTLEDTLSGIPIMMGDPALKTSQLLEGGKALILNNSKVPSPCAEPESTKTIKSDRKNIEFSPTKFI